jgi:MarR family transcriptional regulator, transcriptional regulator for hemolysin
MPADLQNDLLVLLNDVARQIRVCADQMAQAHGLTRAQLIILSRLERQPDVSQNELAAIAEVSAMTIARLIDRLEELGLVKRCADPDDRRIWRLRLTEAAAPIQGEIRRLRARLHSVMTNGIDPAVLAAMTTGLRQMKENVSKQRLAKASAQTASAQTASA